MRELLYLARELVAQPDEVSVTRGRTRRRRGARAARRRRRPRPGDRPGRPHRACAAHGRARGGGARAAVARPSRSSAPEPRRGGPSGRASERSGSAHGLDGAFRVEGAVDWFAYAPAASACSSAGRAPDRRRAAASGRRPILRLEGVEPTATASRRCAARSLELPAERCPSRRRTRSSSSTWSAARCSARAGRCSASCARSGAAGERRPGASTRRRATSCSSRSCATPCPRSTSPGAG